jgi:hypothetical protein
MACAILARAGLTSTNIGLAPATSRLSAKATSAPTTPEPTMAIRLPAEGVGPDHQVHDCAGLYVVDGGAVPSSLGVNPQVTIMALATRAAEILAARVAS